jgi:hypothetical protein
MGSAALTITPTPILPEEPTPRDVLWRRALRDSKTTPPRMKDLARQMESYANPEGYLYVAISTLQHEHVRDRGRGRGVVDLFNEKTIDRRVAWLIGAGWFRIEQPGFKGRATVYQTTFPAGFEPDEWHPSDGDIKAVLNGDNESGSDRDIATLNVPPKRASTCTTRLASREPKALSTKQELANRSLTLDPKGSRKALDLGLDSLLHRDEVPRRAAEAATASSLDAGDEVLPLGEPETREDVARNLPTFIPASGLKAAQPLPRFIAVGDVAAVPPQEFVPASEPEAGEAEPLRRKLLLVGDWFPPTPVLRWEPPDPRSVGDEVDLVAADADKPTMRERRWIESNAAPRPGTDLVLWEPPLLYPTSLRILAPKTRVGRVDLPRVRPL